MHNIEIKKLIEKYNEEYELVTRAIIYHREEGAKDFEIALNAKKDVLMNVLFDLNRINGTVFGKKTCFNSKIFMCAYEKKHEDEKCKGCINI